MKSGVKSGDTDILMGGMIELEKLFFIKKSEDMINRRLKYQTTSATAFNPLNNKGNAKKIISRFP